MLEKEKIEELLNDRKKALKEIERLHKKILVLEYKLFANAHSPYGEIKP